jgi:hypothetical protein
MSFWNRLPSSTTVVQSLVTEDDGRLREHVRPSRETGPDVHLLEVVGTGVDPVTYRFSGGRSAD